jgi:nucleotide-binding universal stress UspA family protein
MLLGGVTAEVIREAPCPVLAVRQSQHPSIPGEIERIVVPVDLSTWSGLAIRYAKEIAAEYDATAVLLHVVEEPVSPDFYYALGGGEALDPRAIETWAGNELERLFHDAVGGDVRFETHVLHGRTAIEIPAFATRKAADLLVMPTHGASAREEPVLGSVTEQVLRRAPCPVLAIKPFGRQPLAERRAGAAVASAVDEIC